MSGRHIGNCIEKTKKREDNKWKSWAKFGDAQHRHFCYRATEKVQPECTCKTFLKEDFVNILYQ